MHIIEFLLNMLKREDIPKVKVKVRLTQYWGQMKRNGSCVNRSCFCDLCVMRMVRLPLKRITSHLPRMLWGFTGILCGDTDPLPCRVLPPWTSFPFLDELTGAVPAVGRKLLGIGFRFLSSTLCWSLLTFCTSTKWKQNVIHWYQKYVVYQLNHVYFRTVNEVSSNLWDSKGKITLSLWTSQKWWIGESIGQSLVYELGLLRLKIIRRKNAQGKS